MATSTKLFIALLAIIATLFGYNYFFRPFGEMQTLVSMPEPSPITEQLSPEEQLLSSLTTKQKVTQLMAVTADLSGHRVSAGTTSAREASQSAAFTESEIWQWIITNRPGIVVLGGSDVSTDSARQAVQQLKSQELSPFIAANHEGGAEQSLNGEGFSDLLSWRDLCRLETRTERIEVLARSAQDLVNAGVDIVFAPVVTNATSSAFLQSRACSNRQEVISERATELVETYRSYNLLPVLKYFPALGTRDPQIGFNRVQLEFEDTHVFRSLLNQFSTIGVMTSHVGVTNQYQDIPCSQSRDCIRELEMSFPDVWVFSDDLSLAAAAFQASPSAGVRKDLPQIATSALKAGNDILVFGESVSAKELDAVVAGLVTAIDSDPELSLLVDSKLKHSMSYKRTQ